MKKIIIIILLIVTIIFTGCILLIDCYGVSPEIYDFKCELTYKNGDSFDLEFLKDSFKIYNSTIQKYEEVIEMGSDDKHFYFGLKLQENYKDTVDNQYHLYFNKNDVDTLNLRYIFTILHDECDARDCCSIIINYNGDVYTGSTCKNYFKITKK